MPQQLDYIDYYPYPEIQETVIPTVTYPFSENPTPDVYAKILKRVYGVTPTSYTPAIADRTSYTNLLTYSEQFNTAPWTTDGSATISANQVANPADGAVTMDALLETVANVQHYVRYPYTFTQAVPHTFSFFARSLSRDFFQVQSYDGTTFRGGDFTFSSTTASGAFNGATLAIVRISPTVVRASITFTPLAASGNVYIFTANALGVTTYAGDITKGLYVWGAQLQIASTVGPYIATTDASRTVSSPEVDSVANTNQPDPFAYLVEEGNPANETSTLAKVVRTYARIPGPQVTYSSRNITKPVAPNQSTGTLTFYRQDTSSDLFVAVGTGSYYTGYLLPANYEVYRALKSGTHTGAVVATGGTFTVTYKTSTTAAQNYNATCTSVATAINALADVMSDGLTVTVNGNVGNIFSALTNVSIAVTVGTTSSRFTVNAASLTGVTVAKAFTQINSTIQQQVYLAANFAVTSHGFNTAVTLALAKSTVATASTDVGIFQPVVSWSSVNANNIAIIPLSINGGAISGYSLLGDYVRTYTPGVTQVSSRITETFYLPGVTTGITTSADIPIVDPDISDQAVLAAILGSSGYSTVEFSGPDQWLGPIMMTTNTEVDLDDL